MLAGLHAVDVLYLVACDTCDPDHRRVLESHSDWSRTGLPFDIAGTGDSHLLGCILYEDVDSGDMRWTFSLACVMMCLLSRCL